VRVAVDAARCQGHNRCVSLAPELFDADATGRAVVLAGGDVTPGLEEAVRRAAQNCPERAIRLLGIEEQP
jgi:ferredoxin